MPSGWRRPATTRAPKRRAAAASSSSRATAGRSTRSRMCSRCRAARPKASPGCARIPPAGPSDSFLAVHNWWHLALYHLEIGEIDEVLALYDAQIDGGRSGVVTRHGRRVGAALAADAARHRRRRPLGGRGRRLGAGRARRLLRLQRRACGHGLRRRRPRDAAAGGARGASASAMAGPATTPPSPRDVGHAAARAILAFGAGDYAEAAELLRPIRSIAHRFGGSHAQRDVIDLTLIEAALRSGQRALAGALAAERSRRATTARSRGYSSGAPTSSRCLTMREPYATLLPPPIVAARRPVAQHSRRP